MNDDDDDLADLLQDMGHNEDEIKKIVARLRRYEKETQLDSIMDSIGQGGFDLQALIREALED